MTITQSGTMGSTGITNNRPNTICDPALSNLTIDRSFDTSCFARTADSTGTFDDTGRNTVRGPGAFNIDASVIKHTKVGPVELPLEVFNLPNHPQFG